MLKKATIDVTADRVPQFCTLLVVETQILLFA